MGIATPLGLGARSAAAAFRAGIARRAEAPIQGRDAEPLVLGLVPDEALPPLAPGLAGGRPRPPQDERMLRLAGLALAEAASSCPGPPPLLLALPPPLEGRADRLGPGFVADLATQAGAPVDLERSAVHRRGGADVHVALRDALALVRGGAAEWVAVGAVDTFLDLRRLATLDAEDRLLAGSAMDGLIPGEGAAFVLLGQRGAARRAGLAPLARVLGVGLGQEPGHRYAPEPYRGDGLAEAFQALFAAVPDDGRKVRSVYAGFNGEGLPAKEWGVALLRSAERFEADLDVQHPADCFGDPGAALGPLLLGLAALGLGAGDVGAPCLVWSTSDRELRGATLLDAPS